MARKPGSTAFNPLFIYGGAGLGKTHLLQAIANEAIACRTARQVHYCSATSFTTEFMEAMRRRQDLTSRYRSLDLLLVDDVQFLAGRGATQEAFAAVFKAVHQRGGQLVLCADHPPAQLPGIEDRLLSCFRWGLCADMQAPRLETRLAILSQKAEAFGLVLPAAIVDYIARHIKSNVRNLEGALNRVKGYALARGGLPNELDLPALLADLAEAGTCSLRRPEDIIEAVADAFDLDVLALRGRSRQREVAQARQVAMFFCRRGTTLSFSAIGRYFGGRDHSTVLHACKVVTDRCQTETALRSAVEQLASQLRV